MRCVFLALFSCLLVFFQNEPRGEQPRLWKTREPGGKYGPKLGIVVPSWKPSPGEPEACMLDELGLYCEFQAG